MPKIDYIQTSFAGGELGPSLFGRTDVAQYANACETIENWLIRPYGSVISTPGTRFVRECKISALGTNSTVRLIPFVFNRTQSYIIEMGDKYFRFYTDKAVVTSTGTTPFELAHTYTESELFDVQFVQLNDVIWLTHKNHTPQKLTRLAANNWTIADFAFIGGPFEDDNTTTTTLQSSGSSGTVTITLSNTAATSFVVSSGSTRGHNNTYWKIGDLSITDVTTGLQVQGYVQITTVTSPSTATATVKKTLSTTASTTVWAEAAWSDVNGWPGSVAFHESRLFFARTNEEPQKIWGSKSFIYDDFALDGANDDDGLNLQLASNEANEIQWIVSGQSLIAGTYGGEFIIKGGTDTPLTPSNANALKQTSWGSEPIVPKKIGNFFYYVQRFGKKLRELFYFWDLDTYKSVDKTILSPHILGDGVVDMAYQQNPDTILYCVLTNGTLATLTREVDQEMQAWSRQKTDGLYESIASIPSQSSPYDEIWVVVKRTITPIGGTPIAKRYIEVFEDIIVPTRQDLGFYVHSGLTYNAFDAYTSTTISLNATAGTSVVVTSSSTYFDANDIGQRIRVIDNLGIIKGELEITHYTSGTIVTGKVKYTFASKTAGTNAWGLSVESISGLDHLETKTVSVLADGGTDKPNKVVSNGTITLAHDYFVVNVGLPYDQIIFTLPSEAGSQRGTAVGKIQKINEVALKVNRSHKGFYVGGSETEYDTVSYIESTIPEVLYTGSIPNADFILERISFRDPVTPLGTPEMLYTGIIPNISFRDDYRRGSQIYIKNSDPLPIELLSIISTLETFDK